MFLLWLLVAITKSSIDSFSIRNEHRYYHAYRPVLFAGLLKNWGQKGPAEIEPKRAWTFRHVHWLAQHHGIAMQTPAQHPFNPLAHLRLLLACAPAGATGVS